MYYGIVRAVIQDLRLKAHEIYDSMGQAYKLGIAQPSRRNLSHCTQAYPLSISKGLDDCLYLGSLLLAGQTFRSES